MERPLKLVTAGIIEENGKVLLSQRRSFEHLAMSWEFPGGKIGIDEDPRDCLKREFMEELGVEISVHDCFDVIFYRYETFNVLLIFYKCKLVSGIPTPRECNAVQWVPYETMQSLYIPPADAPIVERLVKEYREQCSTNH